VPLHLGPLTIPWPGNGERPDPYWESFLNRPIHDPRNVVAEMIRRSPEGAIAPTKGDIHTPEITSRHIKELARYVGAKLVGIVEFDTDAGDGLPFGIVCCVGAEHDPRRNTGLGGQVPVQNGLFVTFVVAAYIRELGFRATAAVDENAERLAVAAGLGKLSGEGRLVAPRLRRRVHVAEVIRTDLPLAPDGKAVSA
jgi:hypothetical protein